MARALIACATLLAALSMGPGGALASIGAGHSTGVAGRDLACGVCSAMAAEVDRMLEVTSVQKTQLVGALGRRMGYTRSEARRTDVLDRLCEKMSLFLKVEDGSPVLLERPAHATTDEELFSHKRATERLGVPPPRYWICEDLLQKHEAALEERLFDMGRGWDLTVEFCDTIAGICPPLTPLYFRADRLERRATDRGGERTEIPFETRTGTNFTYHNNFTSATRLATWQEATFTVKAGERIDGTFALVSTEGVRAGEKDLYSNDREVFVAPEGATQALSARNSILRIKSGTSYNLTADSDPISVSGLAFRAIGNHTIHIRDNARHHVPFILNVQVLPGDLSKVAMCRSPSPVVQVGERLARLGAEVDAEADSTKRAPAACTKDGGGNTVTDVPAEFRVRFDVAVAPGAHGDTATIEFTDSTLGALHTFKDGVAAAPDMIFHTPGDYVITCAAVDAETGKELPKIKPCSARKVAVYGAPERFEIQMPAGLIADERYSAEAVVAVADATGRAIPTLSAGDITLEIVAEGSTDSIPLTQPLAKGETRFNIPTPASIAEHRITVRSDGFELPPATVTLPVSGIPAGLEWTIDGAPATTLTAGEVGAGRIRIVDAGGRAVLGAAGWINVAPAVSGIRAGVTDGGAKVDGATASAAIAGIVFERAGVHRLRATYELGDSGAGRRAAGGAAASPVKVSAESPEFKVRAASPAKLRRSGPGGGVVISHVPPPRGAEARPGRPVQVQVTDRFGNTLGADGSTAALAVTVKRTAGPGKAHGHGIGETVGDDGAAAVAGSPVAVGSDGVAVFPDLAFDTPGAQTLVFESPGLDSVTVRLRSLAPIASVDWATRISEGLTAYAGVPVESGSHKLLVMAKSSDGQRYDIRGDDSVTVRIETTPSIQGITGDTSALTAARAHFHGFTFPMHAGGSFALRATASAKGVEHVQPGGQMVVTVKPGPSKLGISSPGEATHLNIDIGSIYEIQNAAPDADGFVTLENLDVSIENSERAAVPVSDIGVSLSVTRPGGNTVHTAEGATGKIGVASFHGVRLCDECTIRATSTEAARRFTGFEASIEATARFRTGASSAKGDGAKEDL